ncbi:oligoendopeptidase, pepF/M3 family [Gracilibacillus ureilyticus]|uniref:Oligoendopeptidase, pepF/M3 family n=1 Tax=Gracilibacillus ureilyticus TaxID=531814 RepID=A0A1H9NAU5_9BACI|nr:M3 family oligoendopeptidase [Gracilibacillus ureilyticus]SER32513.1 oligoendopeptidase, pepF/M3 family [Gracilibacillus ureilyticus]
MNYNDTWDLDSIFPGGTTSEELQAKLQEVKHQIKEYDSLLNNSDEEIKTAGALKAILQNRESIDKGLGQASTFVNMWHDAFMNDEHATVVKGQILELYSDIQKLSNVFKKKLVVISDTEWVNLLNDGDIKEVAFALKEIREEGKRLLSDGEEELIAELNKDGLAAWSSIYDTIVSTMTIPYTDREGEISELSVGQAMNRMYADPDPEVREQLFKNWEEAWAKNGPVFADTLNHLTGYRITLQTKHQYKSHLEEPLEYNRMTEDSLNAMWSAVSNNKQPFIDFLNQKAKLLGMEKLAWQDVDAPLDLENVKSTEFTYNEACDFVIDNFTTFGPKLADFARHALENRWVEAEDRPNKRPGGYCTSLPELEESRIFMTFTGSTSDTSTLAHELGHAFHSHVMTDLPELNRNYAMNVAETASTFAETIIGSATLSNAKSELEKISLLNTKLENATAMFMNIHARFLFENAFYEERAGGIVPEKRLNQLMVEAQKTAYGDSLASYHPYFWSSKLHFFIDDVPFYNFPYTFGFLFSLGIYAKYLENPEGFEEKYIALLRDTGSMKVEELAKKHLDADITKEEFWVAGIQLMAKEANEFIRLSDKLIP